ncbi:hypothetical protein DYB35_005991 [Aphanomyces astaci]|uniref:Uncharacterized protein n=1 Tax=Aphanomyces astaci TaxID=112090 RepID=A0A418DGD8_APHAT|nr:hypothetical protein DYB35_005991 [Aphanomyces astaci]
MRECIYCGPIGHNINTRQIDTRSHLNTFNLSTPPHDTSNPSRLVHRHLYPISLKIHALALSDHMSFREVGARLSVPYSTVRNWMKVSNELTEFKGNKKSSNLLAARRTRIIPEHESLLAFIDTQCHQECAPTCTHMVNFLKKHQQPSLQTYMERQKDGCGYENLLKLLQCFCARYGYTHQQACFRNRTVTDLESNRAAFAAGFHSEHGGVPDE